MVVSDFGVLCAVGKLRISAFQRRKERQKRTQRGKIINPNWLVWCYAFFVGTKKNVAVNYFSTPRPVGASSSSLFYMFFWYVDYPTSRPTFFSMSSDDARAVFLGLHVDSILFFRFDQSRCDASESKCSSRNTPILRIYRTSENKGCRIVQFVS